MKIYYSPYFNGHSFIDYAKREGCYGGLLGEDLLSTEGLLSRLELMCGMSAPEPNEEKRIEEYYDVLKKAVNKPEDAFYISISNDDKDQSRLHVTTELLRWRDTLIMAGWDKKSPLPGKLDVIRKAETYVLKDGELVRGSADRWRQLYESGNLEALNCLLDIKVMCPRIIVPTLVQSVINKIADESCYNCEGMVDEEVRSCKVVSFNELYEAYQWLSCETPKQNQVIVCRDGQRLDAVLRSMAKPMTSGDANIGCHHVINDVRSMLDVPSSLVWIDCNGGYDFHYPYDFMSEEEASTMKVPSEKDMIQSVHRHMVSLLNGIDDVTLVTAAYDKSQLLAQHPMAASALRKKEDKVEAQKGVVNIPEKESGSEIRFVPQAKYEIGRDAMVGNHRMSYSALEKLIQYPFNHVVEKELGLNEPFDDTNISAIKGTVAHKVIELMVKEKNCIDTKQIGYYLQRALDDADCVDSSIGKCILRLAENQFELDDLQYTLASSLSVLKDIIDANCLEIVGSEVAIPEDAKSGKTVKLETFGPSLAYIDMVLKKKGTEDYYIFDFKYSVSDRHKDKLAENKSIQFAIYKEIFSEFYNGGGKVLKGYGYYLFPKSTLYVPNTEDKGDLKGDGIELVEVDTSNVQDTLDAVEKAFLFRQDQFKDGVIEEGENMPVDDKYETTAGIFPLEKDENNKRAPFSPNHIVLKNQIK